MRTIDKWEIKRQVKNVVSIALSIIAIIATLVFVTVRDDKNWNDGNCTKCNGNYTFVTTEKGSKENFIKYIYKCDTCDHVIVTFSNMN